MRTEKEIAAGIEKAWQEYVFARDQEPEYDEYWFQEYEKKVAELMADLDKIIEMEKKDAEGR